MKYLIRGVYTVGSHQILVGRSGESRPYVHHGGRMWLNGDTEGSEESPLESDTRGSVGCKHSLLNLYPEKMKLETQGDI